MGREGLTGTRAVPSDSGLEQRNKGVHTLRLGGDLIRSLSSGSYWKNTPASLMSGMICDVHHVQIQ